MIRHNSLSFGTWYHGDHDKLNIFKQLNYTTAVYVFQVNIRNLCHVFKKIVILIVS